MKVISGNKTVKEVASDHTIQINKFKKHLLDGATELITRNKKNQVKKEGKEDQASKTLLFKQIGKLEMKLKREKISSSLMLVNCES